MADGGEGRGLEGGERLAAGAAGLDRFDGRVAPARDGDADGGVAFAAERPVVAVGVPPRTPERGGAVERREAHVEEVGDGTEPRDPEEVEARLGDRPADGVDDAEDVLGLASDEAAEAEVVVALVDEGAGGGGVGLGVPPLDGPDGRPSVPTRFVLAEEVGRVLDRQLVAEVPVVGVRAQDEVVGRHPVGEPELLVVVEEVFGGRRGASPR